MVKATGATFISNKEPPCRVGKPLEPFRTDKRPFGGRKTPFSCLRGSWPQHCEAPGLPIKEVTERLREEFRLLLHRQMTGFLETKVRGARSLMGQTLSDANGNHGVMTTPENLCQGGNLVTSSGSNRCCVFAASASSSRRRGRHLLGRFEERCNNRDRNNPADDS